METTGEKLVAKKVLSWYDWGLLKQPKNTKKGHKSYGK